MDVRLRYLPISLVRAGMVLGTRLNVPDHGVVRFCLPEGHVLTEENLRQLAQHHAEYVCVGTPDERSPEMQDAERSLREAEMTRIFGPESSRTPEVWKLYEAVRAYRMAS